MQSFLPTGNFLDSSRILDNSRLGKQRSEARDILRINVYLNWQKDLFDSIEQREYLVSRYKSHPAILMWQNYETALCFYGFIICGTWKGRKSIRTGLNFKDNLQPFFVDLCKDMHKSPNDFTMASFFDGYLPNKLLPEWLYDDKFHSSHRSALLYKDYEYYKKYNWSEYPVMNYFWPIRKGK